MVLVWFHLVLVFRDRISLRSPSCLGMHSVDQGGLVLEIPCFCLPSGEIKGMCHQPSYIAFKSLKDRFGQILKNILNDNFTWDECGGDVRCPLNN